MSDWIEGLKKQDEQQADAKHKQDELRLHEARIIRAKGSTLWTAVIECLRADTEQLRIAFPNDNSRLCDLVQRGDSFTLTSRKLPFKIMELTLNLDGLCVDVQEAIKRDRFDQSTLSPKEPIKFALSEDEDVEFAWRTVYRYREPSQLAEALIKYVCGIV